MIGLAFTIWSAIRSSRIAMICVFIGIALVGLWLYIAAREKAAVAQAIAASVEAAMKRNERSREIHAEIMRLPVSARADRLRKLDRRS